MAGNGGKWQDASDMFETEEYLFDFDRIGLISRRE